MTRLPYRERDELPPAARQVFDDLESVRGYVPNLYHVLANAPAFLRGFVQLGETARSAGSLPARLKEIAILTVARKTGAATMWVSHLPLARAAGLSDGEILALPVWQSHSAFSEHERAVMRYAEEVTRAVRPQPATWEAVHAELDDEQMMELVFVVAFYNMVARVSEPPEVDLDPRYGQEPRR